MRQSSNIALYGAKIFSDAVRDIIFFPLWWYSKGLLKVVVALKDLLIAEQRSLGLFVWAKNIFVPMYGQYDWAGRLVSFMVRFFQVCFRAFGMLVWLVLACSLFLLWICAPFVILYQILYQLSLI